MVRDIDGGRIMFDSQKGVFHTLDAFWDNGKGGHVLDGLIQIPCVRGVVPASKGVSVGWEIWRKREELVVG